MSGKIQSHSFRRDFAVRVCRKMGIRAAAAFAISAVCSCSYQKLEKGAEKMGKQPDYIIDVRSAEEFGDGHVQGAILIPHTEIAEKIREAVPNTSSTVALYCRSGNRAGIAKTAMQELGYQNVENLGGVESAATALGKPVVK